MTGTLKTRDMWAVVPVKCLRISKTRLAPVLDRVQRARVTLAMVHDVLAQLMQVKNLAGVGVLSSDERVQQLARQLNVRVWSGQADALNSGLQAVANQLAADGFGIMVAPCDLPSARAQDYRQLLCGHGGGVTLVEATADGGTNALLRDAGVNLSFHFGPGSFAAHKQEAKSLGISLNVAEQPRMERDIDRPEDLRWLLASDHDCRTRDYLRQVWPELMHKPGVVDWKKTA